MTIKIEAAACQHCDMSEDDLLAIAAQCPVGAIMVFE